MKKAIVLIGGLTVIAVGAYLFFKSKKTTVDTKSTDNLPNSGTGTLPNNTIGGLPNNTSTTVIPKVDEVLEVSNTTKNAQEAVTLASQIFELKNKKTRYYNMSISEFSKTKEGKEDFFKSNIGMLEILKENALKEFDRQLKILNDKIVALGYVEVNGSIVKLN